MKKPKKRRTSQLCIWMDAKLKAQLDVVKEREGLPITRQVELALALWFRTRPAAAAAIADALQAAGFEHAAAEVGGRR